MVPEPYKSFTHAPLKNISKIFRNLQWIGKITKRCLIPVKRTIYVSYAYVRRSLSLEYPWLNFGHPSAVVRTYVHKPAWYESKINKDKKAKLAFYKRCSWKLCRCSARAHRRIKTTQGIYQCSQTFADMHPILHALFKLDHDLKGCARHNKFMSFHWAKVKTTSCKRSHTQQLRWNRGNMHP